LLRVHWCIGSRSGTSHSIHIAISLGAPTAISFSVFLTLFSKICAPEFFFSKPDHLQGLLFVIFSHLDQDFSTQILAQWILIPKP
jgi:hypothetical protein